MINKDHEKILQFLELDPNLEAEDFDSIISELQRIIHDESVNEKGYQAKFARMISELQEKRKNIKEVGSLMLEMKNMEDSDLSEWLLDKLKKEIENSSGKDKFDKLLRIAQVRENLKEGRTT